METLENSRRKNLTPAQLWSGARFFLLLNLSLIICAAALNFYCAPNHFVFGGTTGLSIVLATCFPALSVSTFMWITNAVLDVLGCVFLGIRLNPPACRGRSRRNWTTSSTMTHWVMRI